MEFSDYDIHGEILFPRTNSPLTSLTYPTISNTSFLNYRNTLLQGELLHFYVLLKIQGISFNDSFNILNNIHFQISFQTTESNTPEDNNTDSFHLSPTNTSSLSSENENIINKTYDNTNNIMIYHILKHISVPVSTNNNIVLLQLNIMIKNENTDTYMNNNTNLLESYHNGYFKYIDEYKVIKSLFKEVTIINIVSISNTKQYNVELNTSLLQIQLENITGNIDLVDTSLKYSKYLKEASQDEIEQFYNSNNSRGIDINIQDIQILKEQTTINNTLTNSQYVNNINTSNFTFEMFNKEFPINISPTEQYNLVLKINKPTYLNETLSQIYTHSTNEQDNNDNNNNISFPYCLNVSQTFISNKTSPLKSKQFHLQCSPLSKSLDNVSVHINSYNNNNNIIEEDNTDDHINVVKVYFNTPVVFEITSDILYDKLYICVILTWCNEINRLLKVEMVNPTSIIIYEYFDICLKIKNISTYEMDISLEINDDDNNSDINNVNTIPSVLSQIQTQSYGMLKRNEHKEIILRFLPLTIGYIHLPSIVIVDNISKKRFHIMCNNKLIVFDKRM